MTAIIVLHEIYGINPYITELCNQYHKEGYDVFCPNLLNRKEPFSYCQAEEAYDYFINCSGFDLFQQVNLLIERLKITYQKVVVIGFSVGATVAWRCSENPHCDLVICHYGSRIRDYLNVSPKCKTLLIFAKYDSFDVVDIVGKLKTKENIKIEMIEGKHGFCDWYTDHYNQQAREQAESEVQHFLNHYVR